MAPQSGPPPGMAAPPGGGPPPDGFGGGAGSGPPPFAMLPQNEIPPAGATLIGIAVMFTVLVLLFVAFRFVRACKMRKVTYLDGLVLLALLLDLGNTALFIGGAIFGAGRHIYQIGTARDPFLAIMLPWAAQSVTAFCLCFAKAAVGLTLYQLGLGKAFNVIILVTTFIVVFGNAWAGIACVVVCNPAENLGPCNPGNAIMAATYFRCGSNIFADVVFFVAPEVALRKVKLTGKNRLVVRALLGFMLLAAVMSALKLNEITKLMEGGDVTYAVVGVGCFSIAESSLSIMASCLPAVRQIVSEHIPDPIKSRIRGALPRPKLSWNSDSWLIQRRSKEKSPGNSNSDSDGRWSFTTDEKGNPMRQQEKRGLLQGFPYRITSKIRSTFSGSGSAPSSGSGSASRNWHGSTNSTDSSDPERGMLQHKSSMSRIRPSFSKSRTKISIGDNPNANGKDDEVSSPLSPSMSCAGISPASFTHDAGYAAKYTDTHDYASITPVQPANGAALISPDDPAWTQLQQQTKKLSPRSPQYHVWPKQAVASPGRMSGSTYVASRHNSGSGSSVASAAAAAMVSPRQQHHHRGASAESNGQGHGSSDAARVQGRTLQQQPSVSSLGTADVQLQGKGSDGSLRSNAVSASPVHAGGAGGGVGMTGPAIGPPTSGVGQSGGGRMNFSRPVVVGATGRAQRVSMERQRSVPIVIAGGRAAGMGQPVAVTGPSREPPPGAEELRRGRAAERDADKEVVLVPPSHARDEADAASVFRAGRGAEEKEVVTVVELPGADDEADGPAGRPSSDTMDGFGPEIAQAMVGLSYDPLSPASAPTLAMRGGDGSEGRDVYEKDGVSVRGVERGEKRGSGGSAGQASVGSGSGKGKRHIFHERRQGIVASRSRSRPASDDAVAKGGAAKRDGDDVMEGEAREKGDNRESSATTRSQDTIKPTGAKVLQVANAERVDDGTFLEDDSGAE